MRKADRAPSGALPSLARKPPEAAGHAPPRDGVARERSQRRALVVSILIASVVVHLILLLVFGIWTVAKRFHRPEARFEVKKTLRIPPQNPEHRLNVAKHEAMAAKPAILDQVVSTRPAPFSLPALPPLDLDQMIPLDPSELVSAQVSGLVGQAALGAGLGRGLRGGEGTGNGMNFFGIQAQGQRVLLLFDVSTSVVNKARASGIPLERIQEETLQLIEKLPLASQFSLVQFTGNYMPFTEELIVASPGNKDLARAWVQEKWVQSGTLSASASGVVSNLTGIVGVLDLAARMRPDVIFLISDASFQWRPEGSGFRNVPYEAIKKALEALGEGNRRKVPVHFIAFQPKAADASEWSRLIRRTGGEFRELKSE